MHSSIAKRAATVVGDGARLRDVAGGSMRKLQTSFHFLDASPTEALETARKATGGQDVRIGAGPTIEATSSPSGVTHVTFTRTGA